MNGLTKGRNEKQPHYFYHFMKSNQKDFIILINKINKFIKRMNIVKNIAFVVLGV
ncbi:hypothetical protein MASR1M29_21570 [Cloacibacterium normanense]